MATAPEARVENIDRLLAQHEAKGNIGPVGAHPRRVSAVERHAPPRGRISACGPSAKPTYLVCGPRSADEAAAGRQNSRASGPR